MANELSLNQTVQGEVGEFNYLYVNQEEVDMQTINASIASIESRVSQNETDIQTLADAINDTNGNVSNLTARVVALEGASFDSSIVDNLSTTVQALQTRTGTLESLIGLLTNNNTNDTAIEHRISRLEKTITALKSIYDAKRAVYNIPVDW